MDNNLLYEQLERLAIVLDEIMPGCATLVRDAIKRLKNLDKENEKLKLAFLSLPNWNPVVVRCKDCKHYNPLMGHCKDGKSYPSPEWFCADGERRTEDAGY